MKPVDETKTGGMNGHHEYESILERCGVKPKSVVRLKAGSVFRGRWGNVLNDITPINVTRS